MRIVVILLLLVPVILLKARSQDPADGPPDLQVVEFSTSKFSTYEPSVYISRNNNSNKVDTRSRRLVYEEELRNRNSIENRSRDMLELEQAVMRESINGKPIDLFRYRVNVKNTGVKVVKSVFWDFQASYTEDFDDTTHRQFRCTSKLKPNQSERFEGYSNMPPLRVVSATAKTFNQRIVINRIEYDDGTSWQRREWQLPEVSNRTGGRGNCQPL